MENVIIIGGGPAGMSAAIYAARAGLSPLVIAIDSGQLSTAASVSNFPGYKDDVPGMKIIEDLRDQAKKFGTRIVQEKVSSVDFSKQPLSIKTNNAEYTTRSVILTTGAHARWLGVQGEGKYRGKGVSSCATCDGFFFKGKDVAVIGGGETAASEAIFLSRIANKVYLIHRRDELRVSQFTKELVIANPKIEILWNCEVKEFIGEEKLSSLKLHNNSTGEDSTLSVSGAFVAIGHKPNTDFLVGQLDLDDMGYIKVTDNVKTSVSGVFTAGDVSDWRYQQASVASGFGVVAELELEKWLSENS